MLSFAIPRNGEDAGGLVGGGSRAYLFGPAEVPLAAQIRVEPLGAGAGEVLRCEKATSEAAGLMVQFEVASPEGEAPLGALMLRTCLLPEREPAYLLSLELARHRIMMFLNKLEQWGLFDLGVDHPVIGRFERAREAFAKALVMQRRPRDAQGFSPEADGASRLALWLAIDAGEQLALLNADRQIEGRLSGELFREAAEKTGRSYAAERALPEGVAKSPDSGVVLQQPPVVGCAVDPGRFTEQTSAAAARMCDFVSVPMRWIDLEPAEGSYSFGRTDRWIEWAVRRAGAPVVAGPIIDFGARELPEWLYIWENDYETLRELVYEHIKAVVTRYRRTVQRWTVCSGLHLNDNFEFTLERMMDLTRVCVLMVRKLHPAAKVQVEIDQPWGEYFGANRRSMPPRLYAEMITQAGIGVDAYALRIEMGTTGGGGAARDLMALSDLLDSYADLDKPLSITALGAPSRAQPPGEGGREPGYWRWPWSDEVQARWMTQAMSIALSKPSVHGVCWSALTDPAEGPAVGLLNAHDGAKPAAARLAELRRTLAAKRSPLAQLRPAGAA